MSRKTTRRLADQNRGPSPFPHWHASQEWAKRTTLTRSRFLAMSPEGFADWVAKNPDDSKAWFYGNRWPEGHTYSANRDWLILVAYAGAKSHRDNWPTILLDTQD